MAALSTDGADAGRSRAGPVLALVLLVLELLAAVAFAMGMLPGEAALSELRASLARLGWLGPFAYAGGYALVVPAFVPATLLSIGAGLLFGVPWGFVAASLGSTAGACAAFLIARRLARARVGAWTERHPRFAHFDAVLAEGGFRVVALTRLSPMLPFSALNYAYGVTRVRFSSYALASWLAMAPGSLLYVMIGSLAARGSAAGADGIAVYRWTLSFVGIAATAGLGWALARYARRMLARGD